MNGVLQLWPFISYNWLFQWHYTDYTFYKCGFVSTYNWYNSGHNCIMSSFCTSKNTVKNIPAELRGTCGTPCLWESSTSPGWKSHSKGAQIQISSWPGKSCTDALAGWKRCSYVFCNKHGRNNRQLDTCYHQTQMDFIYLIRSFMESSNESNVNVGLLFL